MTQISCEVCGTVFECVQADPGAKVACPTCANQVVVRPPVPTAAAVAGPPTATPVRSTPPMAQPVVVALQQPPPSRLPTPPHLSGAVPPSHAAAPPSTGGSLMKMTATQSELKDEPHRASKRARRVIAAAVCMILLVFFVGSVYALHHFFPDLFRNDAFQSITVDQERDADARSFAETPWTDASTNRAQRIGGIKVKVTRVEFGEVLAKDLSSTVQSSEGSFLQIFVRVENGTQEEVTYQSWYGNMFELGEKRFVATLVDSENRKYQMITFGDASAVRGHSREAVLRTRNTGGEKKHVDDVLIFDVPQNIVPEQVEYFRLDLPAAAVGQSGRFRFQIPGSMINQTAGQLSLGQPSSATGP